MSWSVSAIGKRMAVVESIAQQFASSTCAEPEETVRQAAIAAINAALLAQNESAIVKVDASGSQSFKDWNAKTGVSNALRITVEPLHGFVE